MCEVSTMRSNLGNVPQESEDVFDDAERKYIPMYYVEPIKNDSFGYPYRNSKWIRKATKWFYHYFYHNYQSMQILMFVIIFVLFSSIIGFEFSLVDLTVTRVFTLTTVLVAYFFGSFAKIIGILYSKPRFVLFGCLNVVFAIMINSYVLGTYLYLQTLFFYGVLGVTIYHILISIYDLWTINIISEISLINVINKELDKKVSDFFMWLFVDLETQVILFIAKCLILPINPYDNKYMQLVINFGPLLVALVYYTNYYNHLRAPYITFKRTITPNILLVISIIGINVYYIFKAYMNISTNEIEVWKVVVYNSLLFFSIFSQIWININLKDLQKTQRRLIVRALENSGSTSSEM